MTLPLPVQLASAAAAEPPEPFPPLDEEVRRVESVMPAWMGISYRAVVQEAGAPSALPRGAARIIHVYDDSPAAAARLRPGDVILGLPGRPFTEPHQLREWIMRFEIGGEAALDVSRDEKRMQVALHPAPFPLEMPKLPGPPRVGSVAPPVELDMVRGEARYAASSKRLLFFWATWCLICKDALPEIEAFAAARGVEVVAITDEERGRVDAFLADPPPAFPAVVGLDRYRQTFLEYGVSGTPTFVLIEDGVVRHYQSGYARQTGLKIEGWRWREAASHSRPGSAVAAP
jgi:thiol-disulfide isomerase/thioredoxin